MKKTIYALFTGLLLCLGMSHIVKADEYLRIGMEAAYAPFNWTQEDDSNGAVKIDGTNQYANGYDVQIAKKVAEGLGKTSNCKNILERFNSCPHIWENRYDHRRNEPYC